MTFEQLNLNAQILTALKNKGYTEPTLIQEKAIPFILEGKDIFGSAQTGTGKTAAFALPIIQMLTASGRQHHRGIKALILAPTRELAQQISDSFNDYGKGSRLKQAVIYGGVSQRPQENALRNGADIVIATPGRLLDLIGQGYVKLGQIEFFVLDEVDRMLDMGFIHDIKKIIEDLPKKKQTLFFSATLPNEIKKLADGLLHDPVKVQTAPVSSASVNVKQFAYHVDKPKKRLLLREILKDTPNHHILVFTRTKRGADKLAKFLNAENFPADAIHGDKSQGARQRALDKFKKRKLSLLIATDVASRGLDITEVSHVVNFDLPEEPEIYVHRIGRTGRAGLHGAAISLCSPDEKYLLKDIEKFTKNRIELIATPTLKNDSGSTPDYEKRKAPEKSGSTSNRPAIQQVERSNADSSRTGEKPRSKHFGKGKHERRRFSKGKKRSFGGWSGRRNHKKKSAGSDRVVVYD